MNTMKKIFFYINTLQNGGAERVIVNLANNFAKNGYHTTLITSFVSENEYPVSPQVVLVALENCRIKQSRLKRNVTRIAKLRALCKTEKPDVLISFMAEPNFRAVLATIGLPVKTIVSVRNDPNREYAGMLGRFVGKVILPLADGCVFQTEEAKLWFPKRLQKKSAVIYNAVKEDFFNIERETTPREIITCGRLEPQKNQKMLINAFAEVSKHYPDAVLKIYGDGSLKSQLQQQIDDLGLCGKAFLMGATDHVEETLRTADLFVLSSDYEGMPNALMEAMAAGVPCISTDCPCGGPRELFGKELYNSLFACGDVEELTHKICEFFSGGIAHSDFKNVAEAFRTEKVILQWEAYVNLI